MTWLPFLKEDCNTVKNGRGALLAARKEQAWPVGEFLGQDDSGSD